MDHRSFPGCTIFEFASRLQAEATAKHSMVLGHWNGTPMLAIPKGCIVEMVKNWQIVREERQAEHS